MWLAFPKSPIPFQIRGIYIYIYTYIYIYIYIYVSIYTIVIYLYIFNIYRYIYIYLYMLNIYRYITIVYIDTYIYIYIYIYVYIYIYIPLIWNGIGDLGKASHIHKQKGCPKGVCKNRKGAGLIIFYSSFWIFFCGGLRRQQILDFTVKMSS